MVGFVALGAAIVGLFVVLFSSLGCDGDSPYCLLCRFDGWLARRFPRS